MRDLQEARRAHAAALARWRAARTALNAARDEATAALIEKRAATERVRSLKHQIMSRLAPDARP